MLDRQLKALTYYFFALIMLSHSDISKMFDCNDVNNAVYVQWLYKHLTRMLLSQYLLNSPMMIRGL